MEGQRRCQPSEIIMVLCYMMQERGETVYSSLQLWQVRISGNLPKVPSVQILLAIHVK